MSIRLITLGGLQLVEDGRADKPSVQRSRIALLVYLAVQREVTRDQAASVFWPESDSGTARHNLSQALYALRQSLGDGWLSAVEDRLRVLSGIEIDALRFEEAVNAQAFDDALRQYGGPFLDGVDTLPNSKPFENWVDSQRAHFERLHRRARREQIEGTLSRQDPAQAIATAQEWVKLSPLEDEAQHRLIELLAAHGQSTEAVRQYEVYERLLASEELQPLDETRALIASIRRPELTSAVRPVNAQVAPAAGATATSDLERVRELGEGSVARVYLARERALKRLVAVKVLRSELAANEIACRRFEREAQAAASISHPNIMAVYRVGHEAGGVPFIVMEHIEGRTLADLLIARGPFSAADTRHAVASVAQALNAVHARDVVHRDVRPANVMLEDGTGRVVLMDFGIAALLDTASRETPKLTRAGEMLGDVLHMSPEQRRGDPVTRSSDMYCLGVLAYELLTGRVPTADHAPLSELRPDVDPELTAVVRRCLAPNPQHRPTAAEVAAALRAASEPAQPVLSPNPLEDFGRQLRQRKVFRVAVGYAAAVFVTLQAAEFLVPASVRESDAWYQRTIAVVFGGFPIALLLSWFFDFTRAGIEPARQRLVAGRIWLPLIGLALSAAAAFGVWALVSR